MNIATMAAQYLTPMIVEKIAKSFGITNPVAQKAIAAIVPAHREPARRGEQTRRSPQNPRHPRQGRSTKNAGQPRRSHQGPQASTILGAGTGMLGSLLGQSGLGSLTGALAKFTGIEDKVSGGLLALVGPVALAAVAKQQKESGLDPAGLARMLLGQKGNIAAAFPQGFGDLLQGTGSSMPSRGAAHGTSAEAG